MNSIYLTGISGFIGKNLANRLDHLGYRVGGLSRKKQIDGLNSACNLFFYDGMYPSIEESIKSFNPDLVIHLAGLYITEHTACDIETLIDANIKFSSYLYEATAQCGVKNIINTGTSWEYFKNNDCIPANFYAATKSCTDAILRYYIDAKKIKAINLKIFDTYGPNDDRKKLFYLLIDALINNKKIQFSQGNQLIDLVYIDDVIQGYLKCINLLKSDGFACETYGLGTGEPQSLKSIVEIFEKVANKKINIDFGAKKYREREVMVPWSNFEKIPNWHPNVNIYDGIKKILRIV